MQVKAYILHKRAEEYSDCQDYFGIDFQNNRIAVSDGMSQSIYPQWWASILVKVFLELGTIPKNLQPYQLEWQKKVTQEIHNREQKGTNPWRLKNSIAEKNGAGATLCGFSWSDEKWSCECIGDSCLIEIYHDYKIKLYSSQNRIFDNHPDYLDSFNVGKGEVVKYNGTFDVKAFLIVTDPFAEFFQKNKSNLDFIKERIKEIENLTSHKSFEMLVERWREEYELHNDDSTLILLSDFDRTKQIIESKDNYIDSKCCIILSSPEKTLQHNHNEALTKNEEVCKEELIKAFNNWLYQNKYEKFRTIKKALIKLIKPSIKQFIKQFKNNAIFTKLF